MASGVPLASASAFQPRAWMPWSVQSMQYRPLEKRCSSVGGSTDVETNAGSKARRGIIPQKCTSEGFRESSPHQSKGPGSIELPGPWIDFMRSDRKPCQVDADDPPRPPTASPGPRACRGVGRRAGKEGDRSRRPRVGGEPVRRTGISMRSRSRSENAFQVDADDLLRPPDSVRPGLDTSPSAM